MHTCCTFIQLIVVFIIVYFLISENLAESVEVEYLIELIFNVIYLLFFLNIHSLVLLRCFFKHSCIPAQKQHFICLLVHLFSFIHSFIHSVLTKSSILFVCFYLSDI